MKYSFSEVNDSKGVISADVEKGSCEIEKIELVPLRDMLRLKAGFTDFLNSNEFDGYTDDYIEVELTDRNLVTNPHSALRERFPWLLSVRQQALPTGGDGPSVEISGEERSIFDDFSAFQDFLYQEEPSSQLAELFNDIYQKRKEQ